MKKPNSSSFFLITLSVLLFLSTFLVGIDNPKVVIETEFGDITLELYIEKAPLTVANFLRYVKESRLKGATFYRIVRTDNQPVNPVKIAVIQGGIFDEIKGQSLPPIKHETTKQTGILHKDGVISMARGKPGTASSEFFICIGDQPELDFGGKRNPDLQGFAAFGKIIKGMDTALKIHKQPAKGQYLFPKINIIRFKIKTL